MVRPRLGDLEDHEVLLEGEELKPVSARGRLHDYPEIRNSIGDESSRLEVAGRDRPFDGGSEWAFRQRTLQCLLRFRSR